MDPATIALVIAGALAALGIKRGARRPKPEPAEQGEPEYAGQVSVRPSRLEGGGLRPAVTEKDDREAEGEVPAPGFIGASAGVAARSNAALLTGGPADVVGVGLGGEVNYPRTPGGTTIPTTTIIPNPRPGGYGTGSGGKLR